MSGAHVVFSHRMEFLFEHFQKDLLACYAALADRHGLEAAFIPIHVVVPSSGIGRWLGQQLSRCHGVSMNVQFELPGSMLWRVLRQAVPTLPSESPFDARRTVWPLFDKLGAISREATETAEHGRDHYAGLRPFLSQSLEIERYEFAKVLAKQYELYVSSRPDWLAAWSQKQPVDELKSFRKSELWQAAVWRDILSMLPGVSDSSPVDQFASAIASLNSGALEKIFPSPTFVFAGFELSEQVLEVLRLLAQVQQEGLKARFYQIQPCQEYWHDLVSARAKAKMNVQQFIGHELFEQGHELLVTWGHAYRANRQQLEAKFEDVLNESVDDSSNLFPETLLGALQRSFVSLTEIPEGLNAEQSLRVVSCHSARRQVERLGIELVQALRGGKAFDEALKPDEVLIVSPKLADFAPYIDAMWGSLGLPFHVAGISAGAKDSQVLVNRFLALLANCQATLSAQAFFDTLRDKHLSAFIRVDNEIIDKLERDAPIAGMLAGLGDERYSILTGLRRLLLGAATGPVWLEHSALPEIAPSASWGAIEIKGLEPILRLAKLFARWQADIGEQRTAQRWREWMIKAWCDFCVDESGHQALLLPSMPAPSQLVMSFDVVAQAWKDTYAELVTAVQPLGKILVVPPGALRAVPYRLIVWLGMDEGSFPLARRSTEWQLAENVPRLGDRITRLDERADFLDSMLAARESFWVFYQGVDPKSDEVRNPSILVQELLRFLPKASLQVEQTSLNEEPAESSKEFTDESANPVNKDSSPDFEQLAQFLLDPSRYYVEKVLGVRVSRDAWLEEEAERLALSKSKQRSESFEANVSGRDPVLPLNAPLLPGGALGQEYQSKLQALKANWDQALGEQNLSDESNLIVMAPRLEASLASRARSSESIILLAWLNALHVFGSSAKEDLAIHCVCALVPENKGERFSLKRYAFRRERFAKEDCEAALRKLYTAYASHEPLPLFASVSVAMALNGYQKPGSNYQGIYDEAALDQGFVVAQESNVRFLYGNELPDLDAQVMPLARDLLGDWSGID